LALVGSAKVPQDADDRVDLRDLRQVDVTVLGNLEMLERFFVFVAVAPAK
jgi:hypothetical protein